MVIDTFSKYAWAVPIKSKSSSEIIDAFTKIFMSTDRRPIRLQTDKGREYNNKPFIQFLKNYDIIYNTTTNDDTKACIAERLIRTIKGRLFKYLYFKGSLNYTKVLPKILIAYNNTIHSSTKYKPIDIDETNVLDVYNNLKRNHKHKYKSPKFKVGEHVRISKYKKTFEKSYLTNYSDEIFKIKNIIHKKPVVYKLCDLDDEIIEGIFYEQELQKVLINKSTAFAVDKILKRKYVGRSLKLFVKWRGYPDKFNSWIDSTLI